MMAFNTGALTLTLWAFYAGLTSQLTSVASAERILMIPMLHGSHVVENMHLGDALIQHGHDVHLALPQSSKYNAMVAKSRVKPLNFETPEDAVLLESQLSLDVVYNVTFRGYSQWGMLKSAVLACDTHCDAMMHDKTFLNNVRQLQFDVMIVSGISVCWCVYLLPHYMGVPHITLSSYHTPWMSGLPTLPSFQASPVIGHEAPFSMLEKLGNTALLYSMGMNIMSSSTGLLQEFEPQMTSWAPLFRQSLIFLVYRDYMLDGAGVNMPNVIQTPALSYGDAKPLAASLTSKMTSSRTIVVSFGSAADTLPMETAKTFIDAFANFRDFNIFWRLKNRDNLKLPDNVHLLNWLPQNDLLGHNSTRLFISHCGAGGVYEAMYHAVPIVCVPMFAEQEYNAAVVVNHDYGLKVDLKSFTASELVQHMHDVMASDVIHQAITHASSILHDRRAPAEEMVYWIEHVMKYGGEYLRPVTMDMPLYELLCLDVIAVILLTVITFLSVIICVVNNIYKRVCRSSLTKNKRE